MFPADAEELECLSRMILKYFTGVEKIVVVDRDLFRGHSEPPLKQIGPAKAMLMLCDLRKLREIVFLDEKGYPVGFQQLVDKIKELKDGKGGEKVVVRLAETKVETGAGFELSHWSL